MRDALNSSRFIFCLLAVASLVIAASGSIVASGRATTSGATNGPHATVGTPRADEVTGEVTLTQSGSDAAPDASQVVVWLTPSGSTTMPHADTDRPRYRLVQHNKRFEPGLLVVPVGSVGDFPNEDP